MIVVEVNEGVVEASRQGIDWWTVFSQRFRGASRMRETKPACVVGGLIEIECDDQEHAEWLMNHMVEFGGLPRTAVKVKKAAA